MNMRSIFLTSLVLALSVGANLARADTLSALEGPGVSSWGTPSWGTLSSGAPSLDDGTGDSGLTGWFFNPPQSSPSEPDPSQAWTSPENIATLEYWLSVVVEIGNDPSLLAEFYGLGMISAPNLATAQATLTNLENPQTPSNVPEPLTLALTGGGLAFLGLYAAKRIRLAI
jgi:hypothetical protein